MAINTEITVYKNGNMEAIARMAHDKTQIVSSLYPLDTGNGEEKDKYTMTTAALPTFLELGTHETRNVPWQPEKRKHCVEIEVLDGDKYEIFMDNTDRTVMDIEFYTNLDLAIVPAKLTDLIHQLLSDPDLEHDVQEILLDAPGVSCAYVYGDEKDDLYIDSEPPDREYKSTLLLVTPNPLPPVTGPITTGSVWMAWNDFFTDEQEEQYREFAKSLRDRRGNEFCILLYDDGFIELLHGGETSQLSTGMADLVDFDYLHTAADYPDLDPNVEAALTIDILIDAWPELEDDVKEKMRRIGKEEEEKKKKVEEEEDEEEEDEEEETEDLVISLQPHLSNI